MFALPETQAYLQDNTNYLPTKHLKPLTSNYYRSRTCKQRYRLTTAVQDQVLALDIVEFSTGSFLVYGPTLSSH